MAGAARLPQLPELPRLDARYNLPTGTVHQPQTATELENLFQGGSVSGEFLKWGDVIKLQAGKVYETSNFYYVNAEAPESQGAFDGNWIYVISDQIANLPANNRVRASRDERWMPVLRSTYTPNAAGTIQIGPECHHFYFAGLKLERTNRADLNYGLRCNWTSGTFTPTTRESWANNIVIDRCYYDDVNYDDDCFGMFIDGADIVVKNCYIANCHCNTGQEGYAITGKQNERVLIDNCYLEATGEDIILGDNEDPTTSGAHNTDWTIRHCYFYKPYKWVTESQNWTVKNHFETKNTNRVLVEDCLFESYFGKDQVNAIVIKSTSGISGICRDTTLRYCDFSQTEYGISIVPNQLNPAELVSGVLIEHLCMPILYKPTTLNVSTFQFSNAGGTSGVATDITIRHVTSHEKEYDDAVESVFFNMLNNSNVRCSGLTVQDNIFGTRLYGLFLNGGNQGTNALNAAIQDYVWDSGNVLWGASANTPAVWHTTGTSQHEASITGVGFVNAIRNDLALASGTKYKNTAIDGIDVGCDYGEVKRRTKHVRSGKRTRGYRTF